MIDFIDNPNFKLAFAVIILVVLLFAVKLAYELNSGENMLGTAYSAGATMRFNQEPTATDQRPYQTGYNYQILNTLPKPVEPVEPVASEGQADARDISNAAEHFDGGFLDQEAVLAAQLYNEGKEHMSPEEQVSAELAAARGFSA